MEGYSLTELGTEAPSRVVTPNRVVFIATITWWNCMKDCFPYLFYANLSKVDACGNERIRVKTISQSLNKAIGAVGCKNCTCPTIPCTKRVKNTGILEHVNNVEHLNIVEHLKLRRRS